MANKLALLGGWNMPLSAMHALVNGLADLASTGVEWLDYPGYEGAYAGTQAWDLDALAERWASRLDEDTVLIGWSLGGAIAMGLSQRLPLAGVVALGTNVQFQGNAPWQMSEALFRTFSRQVRRDYQSARQTFTDLVADEGSGPDAAIKQALIHGYAEFHPDHQSVVDSLALLGQLDLRQFKTPLPKLFVYAEADALVPVACARQHPALPLTQIESIPGGHGLPFSPEAIRVVRGWLKTQKGWSC